MDIAAVEQSFEDLLAAFGDLVVARTRGDAPGAPRTVPVLVRRYRARRRAFATAFAEVDASRLRGEDVRAAENMRGTVAWLDDLEPTPGAAATASVSHDASVRRLRASVVRRYGAAAAAITVGAERMDRLTVLARLATEPDAATRRALFLALETVWRSVDGDGGNASPYRALLRASAARWSAEGSPIEANATSLGLPEGSIEGTLHEILASWRALVGPDRVEPWDYWYTVGGAARQLEPLISAVGMVAANHAYLASLGADPDALGISYDVVSRRGRPLVPVAFTIGMGVRDGIARPPWVFATYEVGSLGNLVELLHESGHALHYAAIRARPAFAEWTDGETAFLEGTADVVGWDATEPDWQRRWLGAAADRRAALLDRYGAVMLDVAWALFELELHRHPDRRPNDVWTELTTDGLGIEPHPEWSWWAMRGQLVEQPGYMANYALSPIVAAAIRARTLEVRGSWMTGDPGWYAFMSERLFAAGASRAPRDLLETFLGEPLTARPLLDDLRAGSEPAHPPRPPGTTGSDS
ncbi:MAG: hypothetical protein ACJ779_06045 [Chloroflexota bacterium]